MDLEAHQLEAFLKAYSYLEGASLGVETYFVDILAETYKTLTGLKGISAIGIDLIRGTQTLSLIKEIGFSTDKILFAGVVDGRNIWANDLAPSTSNQARDPNKANLEALKQIKFDKDVNDLSIAKGDISENLGKTNGEDTQEANLNLKQNMTDEDNIHGDSPK